MFKTRIVKETRYSKFDECDVIAYDDDDGYTKYAACTEGLSIKCGDKIEIYTDDHVNYRGFGAMALHVVR